jgi:outer membrane protease
MKKIYLPLLMFVTLGLSVPAQSTGINGGRGGLSLGTSIGLLAGAGEEIVYRDKNSDDKLSQLLWEIKPLFYAGFDVNYNWLKPGNRFGFFTAGSFKYGFPAKTGVMEDRDWVADEYADWLTHYSVHNNKTENAILIDANIGVSFRVIEKYFLKTYIAYNFMHFSWTAKGGSLLYPPTNTNPKGHVPVPRQIDVITYELTSHIVSPAIAFYGEFNQYFDIEISLKLSPLIWISAKDEHIIGGFTTREDPSMGFYFEPGLLFSFKPNNKFTLTSSVAYRNISGSRGDSVYTKDGSKTKHEDIVGAGYSAFDVGIIAKFNKT